MPTVDAALFQTGHTFVNIQLSTFRCCIAHAPVALLSKNLPGKLRLSSNTHILGWHTVQCELHTATYFIAGKLPKDVRVHIYIFLQRGIDLPSLDVSYFTSLSYYMLLLFGLRGVMSLMFKEDTIDETQLQKQQMTMGVGSLGQDPQKAFEQERTALDTVCTPTYCCIHIVVWRIWVVPLLI